MARNTLTATVQTRLADGKVLALTNRPAEPNAALVAAAALTTTSMGTFTTAQVATLQSVQVGMATAATFTGADISLSYDTTAVPTKNALRRLTTQLLDAVPEG